LGVDLSAGFKAMFIAINYVKKIIIILSSSSSTLPSQPF
jgi:hypothetical protein